MLHRLIELFHEIFFQYDEQLFFQIMFVNDLIDNVILLESENKEIVFLENNFCFILLFQYFEIISHVHLMILNNVLMDVNIIEHQVQFD